MGKKEFVSKSVLRSFFALAITLCLLLSVLLTASPLFAFAAEASASAGFPASDTQESEADSSSDLSVEGQDGQQTKKADARDQVTKITISAVGDCTLGKNYKMAFSRSWGDLYNKKGAGYFLKKTASVFKKDDLTIANLEGVLSGSSRKKVQYYYNDRDGRKEHRSFCHLGKPRYLKALKKGGVDVVTFANNHNIDYGLGGFRDTVAACRKYKMPVAYYDTVVRKKVKGIQIGILSIDQSYTSRKTAETYLRRAMADLGQDCQLIIACMHWGKNYKKKPDSDQKYLGHLCVNLGADMVIGSHPHILQGVERYKGRYIFYSLGNFSYGGRLYPKDADTMIARQTFTFKNGELQIDDNVKVIPCKMTSAGRINNYQPVIKKGSSGRKIISKINSRSRQFGLRFNAKGLPVVKAAVKTGLPKQEKKATVKKAKKVPDIIYKLLRKKRKN